MVISNFKVLFAILQPSSLFKIALGCFCMRPFTKRTPVMLGLVLVHPVLEEMAVNGTCSRPISKENFRKVNGYAWPGE